MERREFVTSALVTAGMASGVAFGAEPEGKAVAEARQEFYQLRTYSLRTGPQLALAQGYFERALIPALNRLEMGPVGAFKLDIGPETPTYYVLIPATSAEALVALDTRLGKDTEYVKAASGFRDAPASAPAFVRTERTLLSAFAGWPKVVAPKKEKRIFQLRTYESPSQVARARKVQMFNEAEIEIFTRTGLTPVFFGDTLILLKRVDPVYPAVARAAHVTGSVVLHAIISKEGKVVEVTAVSGPDLLRSAAVAAVSQWVYKPYLLNGTPTAMDTLVIVNFNFEGATNPPSSTTPAEPH